MEVLQNELSTDDVLRVLADEQRRAIIRELAERGRCEVPVEILGTAVSKRIEFEDTAETDLAIRLRHAHLPALDDVGLLLYDQERRTVRYATDEFAESLLTFLES